MAVEQNCKALRLKLVKLQIHVALKISVVSKAVV